MVRVLQVMIALMIVSGASLARSQASLEFLVTQLQDTDYRVRTQAALALGTLGQPKAVAPLCGALADVNVSARAAAAAALAKLMQEEGAGCIKRVLAKEEVASVRSQMVRSLSVLAAVAPKHWPPPIGPKTQAYVAIELGSAGNALPAEVASNLRTAMMSRLLSHDRIAVAPEKETSAQAATAMRGKAVKGYILSAKVEPPRYEGGSLSQTVRVLIFTYPDRSLKGEVAPRLSQSNTPTKDEASERYLSTMAAENATDTFMKQVLKLGESE